MRIFLLSNILFLLIGAALFADNLTIPQKDSMVNSIYDQLSREMDLRDLSTEQIHFVKKAIGTELESQLAKAEPGELSLDPNAPNYALLGSLFGKLKDVAKTVIGDVVTVVKTVVRPFAKIGLEFLGLADSKLIQSVVGTAADVLTGAISKFGPLIGAVVSYIPVVGPTISLVMDALLPWVDSVVNFSTVTTVATAIGKAAKFLNYTDDVIAKSAAAAKKPSIQAAPAAVAPNADFALLALSEAPAAPEHAQMATTMTKTCGNYMKFIRTLTPDQYNIKLGETEKRATMVCNYFAAQLDKKAQELGK